MDRRSVTFDLSRFYQEAENQGQMPSKNEEIENLSMIAIRLSKSTIGHIRTLTSEGMNSHERLQYVHYEQGRRFRQKGLKVGVFFVSCFFTYWCVRKL